MNTFVQDCILVSNTYFLIVPNGIECIGLDLKIKQLLPSAPGDIGFYWWI